MRGELLRGMQVEPAPLRLHKRVAAPHQVMANTEDAQRAAEALLQSRVEAALAARAADAERQGYAEGFARGEKDGAASAAAAAEKSLAAEIAPLHTQREQLRALAAQLHGTIPEVLARAEDEMVALCFETLCRMVGDGVTTAEQVRSCLRHLAAMGKQGTTVHVHPRDLALVQAGDAASVSGWVADPEVALGGCLLRSAGETLDARLETALVRCKAALLETRARRPAQGWDAQEACRA